MGVSFSEFLRPHRSIPITPWTAPSRWALSPLRFLVLFAGLTIFGVGEAFLLQSGIGNSPWTVLAEGLSLHLPIPIGGSTALISCVVLLLWIPLRERPGFGTILNIIVIAGALQVGVAIIPHQDNYLIGLIFALIGIAAIGIGSGIYITCGLGPGPRDGLMTVLHNRTGIRIGRVRLILEILVLTAGWFLGGTVGLGTALFALLIGQSIAICFGVVSRFTTR